MNLNYLHMTSNNYKTLRQIAEAVIFPTEIGQQDSELQKKIGKSIEDNRISTFRKSTDKDFDLKTE